MALPIEPLDCQSEPTALATHAKTKCTGTLASGTYGKLVVPIGATCDGTEAKIDVRGGVRVHEGGTFILGSEELGADTGKIRGGICAKAPASLQVHFADIKGGLRMRGGHGCFSTVEDNHPRWRDDQGQSHLP